MKGTPRGTTGVALELQERGIPNRVLLVCLVLSLSLGSSALHGQDQAPNNPQPTATPGVGHGRSRTTAPGIRIVRSSVSEERSHGTDSLQCIDVPRDLFREERSVFSDGLPATARLSGAGRTLGLLTPDKADRFKLTLLRRGRASGEYFLRVPAGRAFPRLPTLALGDDGQLVALRDRQGFVVYAGATVVGFFDGDDVRAAKIAFRQGEVFWCPYPERKPDYWGKTLGVLFDEGDEPPLWLRSDVDGSRRTVLLRVDPRQLSEDFPDPGERALGIALRSDGKFWLAGVNSGEIMLATAGGRIIGRWYLPFTMKTQEDDEASMNELRARIEKQAAEEPAAEDATVPPPDTSEIVVRGRMRLFMDVFARGRDLVLTTATMSPARALIVVRGESKEETNCFTFNSISVGGGDALDVAVTDDALWFREPFGSISWNDLEALVAAQESNRDDKEESGTGDPVAGR